MKNAIRTALLAEDTAALFDISTAKKILSLLTVLASKKKLTVAQLEPQITASFSSTNDYFKDLLGQVVQVYTKAMRTAKLDKKSPLNDKQKYILFKAIRKNVKGFLKAYRRDNAIFSQRLSDSVKTTLKKAGG